MESHQGMAPSPSFWPKLCWVCLPGIFSDILGISADSSHVSTCSSRGFLVCWADFNFPDDFRCLHACLGGTGDNSWAVGQPLLWDGRFVAYLLPSFRNSWWWTLPLIALLYSTAAVWKSTTKATSFHLILALVDRCFLGARVACLIWFFSYNV